MIVSHSYSPSPIAPGISYEFSLDTFINSLRGYLQGFSVIDTHIMIRLDDYCYGMEIYDQLMADKNHSYLFTDVRVSAVLKEHKALMLERIKYLYAKGYLDKLTYENYYKIASYSYKAICVIQFRVLWYKEKKDIKDMTSIINSISHNLQVMKQTELLLYGDMIQRFQNKNAELDSSKLLETLEHQIACL